MQDDDEHLERLAERGLAIEGPPWILGHRGAPRLAPENTVASLERALELGLDGVEFDVQPSLENEPVVLHDETLERTTDGRGEVRDVPLTQLSELDAGGWFGKRFAGERLPHLVDALRLEPGPAPHAPLFMVELKTPGLVDAVDEALRSAGLERRALVASFHRDVVTAARDRELSTMLLAIEAHEDDRAFVRRERIDAMGLAAQGWRTAAGELDWPCARWAWSVDAPGDLLEACRRPLAGFNTNEPLRALSVRALVALAPHDAGPYPLEVPELPVNSEAFDDRWAGKWALAANVRNPFEWPVAVEVGFVSRQGAFDVGGSPTAFELAPGATQRVELSVEGGTHSPGADPLLVARYAFVGPRRSDRPLDALVLDAPLVRRRIAFARESVRTRLVCLAERPDVAPPTLSMERRGGALLVSLESGGGLVDPRVVVHLDGRTAHGPSGLRLPLPEDFNHREGGVPFTCAVAGFEPDRPRAGLVWRRWAGGLPRDLVSGEPGRLVPDRR